MPKDTNIPKRNNEICSSNYSYVKKLIIQKHSSHQGNDLQKEVNEYKVCKNPVTFYGF